MMAQPPHSGPPYPESGPPYPERPSSGQPSYGPQPGPGSSQPAYGSPSVPPPSSAPPPSSVSPSGYGPSPYGQPHYGSEPQYGPQPGHGPQPGYGEPQYGVGVPPPVPPKKSRALPIVLVTVAVLLVLCVGGSVAIFLVARNSTSGKNEAADATPAVSGRPATESTPTAQARTITVVEPSKLGGRPKLTDRQFADLADTIESDLAKEPGSGNTVSALYGDPSEENVVIMAAAEAEVDSPAAALTGTFAGAGLSGFKVTGIQSIDPGPLGGVAKCGKAKESDIDIVMCGWADEGSIGWVMWYFESVGAARAEFAKLRGQIEKAN